MFNNLRRIGSLVSLLLLCSGFAFGEALATEGSEVWEEELISFTSDTLNLNEGAPQSLPVDTMPPIQKVDTLVLPGVPAVVEAPEIGTEEQFFESDDYVHSPHKATIYAAVFPGAGQIYNKKYWKLPILYGGIGGLVYAISFNSNYYNKYRSAYRDFLIRDPGNTSYEQFIPAPLTIDDVHGPQEEWFQRSLQNKKRYYKRSRDLSYIVMVGLYVISIIDASVDAHFYDFDISDDLSFRVEPALLAPFDERGSALGLQMRIQF